MCILCVYCMYGVAVCVHVCIHDVVVLCVCVCVCVLIVHFM